MVLFSLSLKRNKKMKVFFVRLIVNRERLIKLQLNPLLKIFELLDIINQEGDLILLIDFGY